MMSSPVGKNHVAAVASERKPFINELFLPSSGRSLGFRIGAHSPGPNLLVASQNQMARQVFQRLLLIPSLNRIRGTLLLITLDRLDDLQPSDSLNQIMGISGPVDARLTLPPVDFDSLDETAVKELVRRNYWAVLRLCAKWGMISGRGVLDRDGREPVIDFPASSPIA